MLKRKIDKYIRDYYRNNRNALLITGARQTGKTFSIREFGRNFKSFIEINFVETPSAIKVFETANNAADILLRISAMTSTPLIKGETLIFFDEVQQCPEIVTAIKFLVDEGSYRYVLSGSLLGVELKDLRSEPVGYMGVKEMFPLDFEEFILNVGVGTTVVDALRSNWENRTPVDNFIHEKLMELFRLYIVVGGMPSSVNKYLETNNLQYVVAIQNDILQLYKRDITQYDKDNKLKIGDVFKLIPSELNAKNKRFILKRLNEHAKFDRYQDEFLWLSNAGVALPVYNVEEPKPSLILSKTRNLFKLFQNDIGLLSAQYANGIQLRIIQNETGLNFGAIYENAVAQELKAHGYDLYYYNSKKRGEIDFLIEDSGMVIPIEVKSGKDYTSHRALTNVILSDEFDIPKAVVLTNGNLKEEGKVVYAPIYMVMFIINTPPSAGIYKVNLKGLR